MSYEVTESVFLKEVAQHQMQVLRDDGIYRHLRFKKPGTIDMYFDLLTWPGILCYTGDMGTFVFQRLEDMFEFFRTDRMYAQSRGKSLCINLGYWSEKLIAVDGGRTNAAAKEFSQEKFIKVINSYRLRWIREKQIEKDSRRELWEAVETEVLDPLVDGEHAAYQAANEFEHEGYRFEELWDHDFTEYTTRFVWCYYALAWGIQKYDELPKQEVAA